MIIKIIPENDIEKQRTPAVEHKGVKEFFMFGNKKDGDEDLMDFQDWFGNYKFLEGNLYYYLTTITEEKKAKSQQQHRANEIELQPPRPQAYNKKQFIKTGKIDDADVQIINADELTKNKKQEENDGQILKFPSRQDEFIETPINEENIQAEDEDENN